METEHLYKKSRSIVFTTGNFTISHLQRKLGISWNRAKVIMDKIKNDKPKIVPKGQYIFKHKGRGGVLKQS